MESAACSWSFATTLRSCWQTKWDASGQPLPCPADLQTEISAGCCCPQLQTTDRDHREKAPLGDSWAPCTVIRPTALQKMQSPHELKLLQLMDTDCSQLIKIGLVPSLPFCFTQSSHHDMVTMCKPRCTPCFTACSYLRPLQLCAKSRENSSRKP